MSRDCFQRLPGSTQSTPGPSKTKPLLLVSARRRPLASSRSPGCSAAACWFNEVVEMLQQGPQNSDSPDPKHCFLSCVWCPGERCLSANKCQMSERPEAQRDSALLPAVCHGRRTISFAALPQLSGSENQSLLTPGLSLCVHPRMAPAPTSSRLP